MKVKSLKLRNFTSFSEASFKFSPNFNLVVGKNGSGKTSLWEAIFYLLFDKSVRTFGFGLSPDNLISRGESFFALRGDFSLDENNCFTIERKRVANKDSKSVSEKSLFVNGERVKVRTSQELLRKLGHIIGLPEEINFAYQALAPVLYLRSEDLDQGRPVSIDLLDYHFSEYINHLYTENLEAIKEIDSELSQLKGQVLALSSKYDDLQELRKKTEERYLTDTQSKIEQSVEVLSEKRNTISNLEIEIDSLLNTKKRLQDEYESLKERFDKKKEEAILINNELSSKSRLLQSEDKSCYVCGQSISSVEEKLESEIQQLRNDLEKVYAELEVLKAKGDETKLSLSECDKTLSSKRTRLDILKNEEKLLKRDIDKLSSDLGKVNMNEDLEQLITNTQKELNKSQKKIANRKDTLLARYVIRDLTKPRSIVRFELYEVILNRLARLADQFLSSLFENRGYRGLQIRLPEGSIRNSGEISCDLIFSDGVFRDIDLSSGEKRRLMLATRLALFLLLKEMSEGGKFFSFVVLDEILDHLDDSALRKTIKILKDLSLTQGLQIFLSTHNFTIIDLLESDEGLKIIEL